MEQDSNEPIRLTQFSKGAGCGCKIAPADLEAILTQSGVSQEFPQLLVGNGSRDDAAVLEQPDGSCIISTTDFFTPIVDDAFDFGRVASANAISDVYAMGGTPVMAIAILGWPIEKLGAALAGKVIEGARTVCAAANIPLAGGHSIDSPEPFFGLAVTGIADKANLRRNNTAQAGDLLYLTKPIGSGVLSTAMKRGLASEAEAIQLTEMLTSINTIGMHLGTLNGVTAMTDVTGFGLLGHLVEMCEGSSVAARIDFAKIPVLESIGSYLDKFIMPDNTMRNFKALSPKVSKLNARQLQVLCDPQTNGGLLISVRPEDAKGLEVMLEEHNLPVHCIGTLAAAEAPVVTVD